MATFVLVHGAWHGGWCYRPAARLLRQAGHEVFTPTLTGLGERAHLGALSISLSTHVEDIASAIVCEEIDNVILCGHSYGGMVVTGVADKLPGKIKALVYLDAFVPESGKALWDYISEAERRYFVTSAAGAGGLAAPIPAAAFACTDPAWVDRRCGPHPIACFLEALALKHPTFPGPKSYVYATGWGQDGPILTPFRQFYERYRNDGRWAVHTVATGHDVMVDDPEGLAMLLVASA